MEDFREEKSSSSSFEDLSNLKEEDLKPDVESKKTSEETGPIDVLGNGQLMKSILVAGESDTRPERTNVCKVNIEGRLQESQELVEKYENFTVQLGDYEVVQGLDMCIPLMNVGEKAEIVCGPRFAYGNIGLKDEINSIGKTIPPETTIIYIVELLSTKAEDDIEELSFKLRKKIGNKKRERGNFWFERQEYNMSIQCYRKALDYLDERAVELLSIENIDNTPSNSELQEILEDRIKTNNNLAMAQMKISAWDAALKSIDSVLACQPQNVKGLFRKGKILDAKGNVNSAIPLLQKAATLDPENRAIQNELSKMILKSKREARNEKDLYQKMLGQAQKIEQTSKVVKNEEIVNKSFKLWGYLLGTILVGVAGMAMYRYKDFS